MRGRLTRLWRGLRRRCPNCGHAPIFESFFVLRDACPACGFSFEREEGYWVGAMTVSLAVVEIVFGLVFVVGLLVTWPDPPWTALLLIGLALNLTLPIVFYPTSKAVWMGLELFFNPPTAAEQAEALTRRADRERRGDA